MKDLVGKVFGRLTVLSHSRTERIPISGSEYHRTKQLWLCRCACGEIKEIEAGNLQFSTQSCGCLSREITSRRSIKHGMEGTPTYKSWLGMRERCHRTYNKSYSRYGGRGIFVCEEWLTSFESFFHDMGVRPEGHTLDRIDPSKGYSKENCRWATSSEQARNKLTSRKITFNGETKNLVDWAKDLGITRQGLRYRLSVMPVEEALSYKNDNK